MKILYAGATSVCAELENSKPYYTGTTYQVLLNGKEVLTPEVNVFSLFDLLPDTSYELTVKYPDGREETETFRTAAETCCLNVKDFGAKGDGLHEDTAAIQMAINAMPDGARLYFPEGTYLTFPLIFRSHMTLELSAGAVLLGSAERERYPILPAFTIDPNTAKEIPFVGLEGNEIASYASLLYMSYIEDVAIVGQGLIDGNAQNSDWWTGFPDFPAARASIFFSNHAKNITFHGVQVANSPCWNMHPYFSEKVSFYNISITAPKNSPNTDAIDPECCDGVNIIGCHLSVGDDCIAVKSGKIELARKYQTPADHHVIRNCLMDFGHGAVTLGSEAASGIRNLSVTQCYFRKTDRGLRIKSRRGRGKDSFITNVFFDNIYMEGVITPLVINMWYNCVDPDCYTEYVWSREHLPVDDRTPHLGSFAFRNMTCVDAEAAACYIDGLPESPIDEVELEHIRISFAKDAKPALPAMQNFAEERCRLGLYLDNVRKIRVRDVILEGTEGKKLIADHYEELQTEGLDED